MAIFRVTGRYGYCDERIRSGNTWRCGAASTSTISLSKIIEQSKAAVHREGIQVVQQRRSHDCRHRVGTSYSQASVLIRSRSAAQLFAESTMAASARLLAQRSGGLGLRACSMCPLPRARQSAERSRAESRCDRQRPRESRLSSPCAARSRVEGLSRRPSMHAALMRGGRGHAHRHSCIVA
jgi:hypothetical protein